MAQLLQYNSSARYRFPAFVGMSLNVKTRKEVIIDLLHDHGNSIPYDRVLEVSVQLGVIAV